MSTQCSPFGKRLFPQVLDHFGNFTPNRLYASLPRLPNDLSEGYRDVSCQEMAQCTNVLAHWIEHQLGRSETVETLCYIGVPDLRGAIVFLAGVKCGYKVLFPSPRNPPATNISLLEQTACTKLLYAQEVTIHVNQLQKLCSTLKCIQIASFDALLEADAIPYAYHESFDDVKDKPIVVLHSSGSTGLPKPITMTHNSFATLDNERNLPTVAGRKNRDLSIYDFVEGGKFYTVFPYFHLAGFLSTVFNPIFTEASSPVLGPALMPPSGELLKQVMKHQTLRALYIPPSLAEQLLQHPDGIDLFKGLDFLCYTGGPFSRNAGEALAEVVELIPLYGSTETFQVPQLRPKDPRKDFAYMEWNPHCKLDMRPSDDETDTYEMILFADDSNKNTAALHHNKPGVSVWQTRDLFKRHPDPRKPDQWTYYGRRDDIIVLSNSEKFNPVPMELMIQSHPLLTGALIVGQGRKQAALLVEPKNDVQSLPDFIKDLWSFIDKANTQAPGQGQILRSKILAAKLNKPFTRAGKGTVVRKLTEKSYAEEIDALYSADSEKTSNIPTMRPRLKPVFPLTSVITFIHEAVRISLPSAPDMSETDDFYAFGLDSLKTAELCTTLKNGLQEFAMSSDLSWISARLVYENATTMRLSSIIYEFLSSGRVPEAQNKSNSAYQLADVQAMVDEFSADLGAKQLNAGNRNVDEISIALTGSTGSLGTELLHNLLLDRRVSQVYCLNRTADAEERQAKSLQNRFPLDYHDSAKIIHLTVDLSKPQLGLSTDHYNDLLSNVDIILHNAWKVDFNLPLRSFTSHIQGVRNLITWSTHSPRICRIMFVSSISCVLNNPKTTSISTSTKNPSPSMSELPVNDPSTALSIGYGQSKYVAERLLTLASSHSNVPVTILRVGQIGGSTRPNDVASPRQEWLTSLIETSRSMGMIPNDLQMGIDWIPMNDLATSILDVLHSENRSLPSAQNVRIFHLVNPHPAPWSLLTSILASHFRINAKPVPLEQWTHELSSYEPTAENLKSKPAIQLLGFFESLGKGREMRFVTENAKDVSETFRDMKEVNEQVLTRWLREWGV